MASPRAIETLEELRRLLELERAEEVARHAALVRERGLPAFIEAGLALADLAGQDEGGGLGGRFLVSFRRRREGAPLGEARIGVGDEVRVVGHEARTLEEGPLGLVAEKDAHHVTVAFDRPPPDFVLTDRVAVIQAPNDVTYRRQVKALGALQAARKGRHVQLRELLFGEGRPPPSFEAPPEDLEFLDPGLNPSQRRAVARALSARDLALVHGPPGTGKTTALIEIVRQARRRGGRVLAAAASNTAVDNMVERLVDAGEPVVRVGHPARVSPQLRHAALDLLVQGDERYRLSRTFLGAARKLMLARDRLDDRVARGRVHPRDARDERRGLNREIHRLMADVRRMEDQAVERVLGGAGIVCTTLVGAGTSLLQDETFDWIIIDEATQATAPATIVPLLRAGNIARLVLAGDHHQLPPTVVSPEAVRQGLAVTVFERAVARWGDTVRTLLEVQYRMHETLMCFPSRRFYEGRLQAAEAVRAHLLRDLPGVEDSPLTATPLEWIDTAGRGFAEEREGDGESIANPEEAAFVARRVHDLLAAGVPPAAIAVITPYAAQVRRLRDLLAGVPALEIGTVDGFQGREKEAVVVSLVRSNDTGDVGFLADVRRMNVAWTRARRKLLIVGDTATLAAHPFYAEMLEYVEAEGRYRTAWDFPDP